MTGHTAARSRFHAFLGVATAAAVLCVASAAWACSPTPEFTLQTSSGLPGSRVLVHGEQFAAPDNGQPITIHWATASGPTLATVAGPEFNVYVVVPADARPGPYVIGAAQQGPWGDVWRAQAFTVRSTSSTATTTPAAAPPAADPAPEPQPEPASSPAPSQAQSPAPAAGSGAAAPSAATPVASPTAATGDRRDPVPVPSPSSSATVAPANSPLPSGSVAPSPLQVGPEAAVQAVVPGAVATEPGAAPAIASVPQPSGPGRTALPQGVWATGVARSGIDVDRDLTSPGAAGAAGVAFLAIGASLLLAGFLALAVTRRRRTAQASGPPTP